MGKASRRKRESGDSLDRDRRLISQVVRRLGLPDSRGSLEDFWTRIIPAVGEDDVEKWVKIGRDDVNDSYDFTYSSLTRALNCSVGWRSWPLEVECTWMLPRLRGALERHDSDSQFFVEIGAGPGAAAAVLSAALNVPALAVDPHPLTAGLPEQLARMTRGDVTSHVASAEDLSTVLAGRTPAAVIGLGVFSYFQPHDHSDDTFSYTNNIKRFIEAAQPAERSVQLLKAIAPADLLLSEQCCPEYLGEVAAAAFVAGYSAVSGGITQLRGAVPGEATVSTAMHFAVDPPTPVTGSLLAENYAPLPVPRPGLEIESLAAEPLRLSLSDADSLDRVQISWANGTGTMRRETFHWESMFGIYTTTNRNYRAIRFVHSGDWPATESGLRSRDQEMSDSGEVEITPLLIPVGSW